MRGSTRSVAAIVCVVLSAGAIGMPARAGSAAQGPTGSSTSLEIIRGIDAPALAVRVNVSSMTRRIAAASNSVERARHALTRLVDIATDTGGSADADAAASALGGALAAETELTAAGDAAAGAHSALQDARAELDRLGGITVVVPQLVAGAQEAMGRAQAEVERAAGAGDRAAAAVATVSAALDRLSGSNALTQEALDAAHAAATAAADDVTEVAAAVASGRDHLSSAITGLDGIGGATTVDPGALSAVATALDAASADADAISSAAAAGRSHVGELSSSFAGVAFELQLTPAQQDDYRAALNDAIAHFRDLQGALGAVSHLAGDSVPVLEGALVVARSLRPAPETRSVTQLDPITDLLFSTLDGVTDIQVKSTDTLAVVDAVIDPLRELNSASRQVYGMLPPAAQGAVGTAAAYVETAQRLALSAEATLYDAAVVTDSLVETAGPVLFRSTGDCYAEQISGVTIQYGTTGSDVCYGSSGPDTFWVYGGGDVVYGRGSADTLHLGHGGDFGHGEAGPDHELGGAGGDSMWGGNGHDHMEDDGKANDVDKVYGGPGSDKGTVRDGDTADYWCGGDGDDPYPGYDVELDWEAGSVYPRADFVTKGNC